MITYSVAQRTGVSQAEFRKRSERIRRGRSAVGCGMRRATLWRPGTRLAWRRPDRLVGSGRDVRQHHRVVADGDGRDKAERRSGTGEVRLAAAKDVRAHVETVLVDQTEIGEARRQIRTRDVDLSLNVRLQPAHERSQVPVDQRGVGTDGLERA